VNEESSGVLIPLMARKPFGEKYTYPVFKEERANDAARRINRGTNARVARDARLILISIVALIQLRSASEKEGGEYFSRNPITGWKNRWTA